MNQRIKELMEQMVIKMLEDDLNHNESIISSEDGKTTISMRQNNLVNLLLYLQLTNENNVTSQQQNNSRIKDLVEGMNSIVEGKGETIHDLSEDEKEKLLEKISSLQQNNKQFRQELADLLQESNEE